MAGRWSTLLILTWVWTGGQVWADAREIGALRGEQRELSSLQDTLEQQRRNVLSDAGNLSALIDSLKGEESEPEELHEALRSSLVLVQRIVDIDRRMEALRVRQDSITDRLRLAYDWEIGMLIQKISQQPDRGLLGQLVIYQEEREALGNEPVGSGLQYGEEMAISPDDSPDQIRQKMELMEDIAARLRTEARQTAEQMRRLEEEHRLRTRVRVFTSEISLFDEHLPEGRVLVRASSAIVSEGGGSGALNGARGSEDFAPIEGTPPTLGDAAAGPIIEEVVVEERAVLLSQRVTAREGSIAPLGVGMGDEMALEIHKLKAHQLEIRQLEEVVRERAATFRQFLDKMLEGEE